MAAGTMDMKHLAEDYGRLLGRIDTWFARCVQLQGSNIACRGGCSECCRSLFDITLLDGWYLRLGFNLLPEEERQRVLVKARKRVADLRSFWPDFSHPYILNYRSEQEWKALMPDDDETPCVLLDESGRCLVYEYRPMTCRLHGLPLISLAGEVLHDEWCTMNFIAADPLSCPDLRADFDTAFRDEVLQFRRFTREFLKKQFNELDTFIPAALLIDFDSFDWIGWGGSFRPVINEPVD